MHPCYRNDWNPVQLYTIHFTLTIGAAKHTAAVHHLLFGNYILYAYIAKQKNKKQRNNSADDHVLPPLNIHVWRHDYCQPIALPLSVADLNFKPLAYGAKRWPSCCTAYRICGCKRSAKSVFVSSKMFRSKKRSIQGASPLVV